MKGENPSGWVPPKMGALQDAWPAAAPDPEDEEAVVRAQRGKETRTDGPGWGVADEGSEKVLAALMGALAIALPQAFHLVGMGSVFLPMHLPVALAGFVVRPGLAASVGMLAPVLSSLITGMPPIPLVPLMVAELATLGGVAALLSRRLRLPLWVALPGAIAARVGVTMVLVSAAGQWLGLPPKVTAPAWIAGGAPGILLQLAAVPLALRLLKERGMR